MLFHSSREVTLNVPQGVGDIFWIYQKISPHFDAVCFNICVTDVSRKLQSRSVDFVKTLPKCKKVALKQVPQQTYDWLASNRFDLQEIVGTKKQERFYSVNKYLEDGVPLDQIDHLEIERSITLHERPTSFVDYMLVYVSGDSGRISDTWDFSQWERFLIELLPRFKQIKICFFGAHYDKVILEPLQRRFADLYDTMLLIDLPFVQVNHLIRNARFFVGYQSGLNILADNFDVPQIMLYRDWLHKMLYTWAKPENVQRKVYQPFLFSSSAESILQSFLGE